MRALHSLVTAAVPFSASRQGRSGTRARSSGALGAAMTTFMTAAAVMQAATDGKAHEARGRGACRALAR